MPGVYTERELRSARLVWCLDVNLAGRTYHLATEAITLTDSDGVSYEYRGAMAPVEVDFAIGDLSGLPDYRAMPVSVVWPDSLAELAERGHHLEGAAVVLSWVLRGAAYEDRRIVLRGSISKPRYSDDGEPASFTVEQNAWEDAGVWPAATATISADTFPAAWDEDQGATYPQPFGHAGYYRTEAGTSNTTSGSPGLVISTATVAGVTRARALLIGEGDVKAPICWVFNAAGDALRAYVHSPTNTPGTILTGYDLCRDGLNQTFSYAVLDGTGPDGHWTTDLDHRAFRSLEAGTDTTSSTATQANGPFWIGFSKADGMGPAVQWEGRALTGAGDVLLWAMERSTVPMDRARWESARRWLNRYEVAGYVDAQVTPWEWVSQNLLPLLPVSVVAGPDGLMPIIWRMGATAAEAVAHIERGPGKAERVGDVEYVHRLSDLVDAVEVRFARRAKKKGEYRRTIRLQAAYDADVPSEHAALRAATAPRAGTKVIETDVVYSESTAWLIAQDCLMRSASAPRRVQYRSDNRHAMLSPGDVVTVTDSGRYWSARPAIVENLTFLSGGRDVLLTLVLYGAPGWDIRPAA